MILSKSCIISIIAYLEERYKFGEHEAGESISGKVNINQLEVEVIKIIVTEGGRILVA